MTRLVGEFARTEGLLAFEFDLDGDCWDVRWRACSSAILESIAPLRRCHHVSIPVATSESSLLET